MVLFCQGLPVFVLREAFRSHAGGQKQDQAQALSNHSVRHVYAVMPEFSAHRELLQVQPQVALKIGILVQLLLRDRGILRPNHVIFQRFCKCLLLGKPRHKYGPVVLGTEMEAVILRHESHPVCSRPQSGRALPPPASGAGGRLRWHRHTGLQSGSREGDQ